MKRITAIIAAFVLTLTSLAACGNSDTPTSEVNPDSFSGTSATENPISSEDNSSDVDDSVTDDETEVSGETDVTDDDPSAVTTTADDDKTVPTTTTTVSGNDEEKPVTTTAEDKKDTAATTTSKKVTTTVKETTTTKKPTTTTKVTTTKKQTTTTKKQTTTTKVTTEKKENSTKGTTMWLNEQCYFLTWDGTRWSSYNDFINKGEKVTAYEQITLDGEKYTKIKTSSGRNGAVTSKSLSSKEVTVKLLTQADMEKLKKELQEYSNSLCTITKTDKVFEEYLIEEYGSVENWYDYRAKTAVPEECSWTGAATVCPWHTYEEAYKYGKLEVDVAYASFDGHAVVYIEWCPNGKGSVDSSVNQDCWNLYALI